MPRGASAKREREYEELKGRFQRSGRYRGRETEVAARIVNKQRSQYGETKKARAEEQHGEAPDRDLPIEGYRHLTIAQIKQRLAGLSKRELRRIRTFEVKHKNRRSLLAALDRLAA